MAGLVLLEVAIKNLFHVSLPASVASGIAWLVGGRLLLSCVFTLPSFCAHLSLSSFPFHKDTSCAGLGPTLMISAKLDHLQIKSFLNKVTFIGVKGQDFNIFFGERGS